MITREFDGTEYTVSDSSITVTENGIPLTLHKAYLTDGWFQDSEWNTSGMLRAGTITEWEKSRIDYVFYLASLKISKE